MKCIICYDKFKTETNLNCGHSFCKKCIETWYDSKNTCPICRKVFSKKEIYDNIKGVKTRSFTRDDRYEKTNIIFSKIVYTLNDYHSIIKENGDDCNDNMRKEIESYMNNFFKIIYNERNLYECKYKKRADNLCLNKTLRLCNNNNHIYKCRNCRFKSNVKKYMNTTLKKFNYSRLYEWEFKLNEVKFF